MNTVEQWKQEQHPLDIIDDVERFAAEGVPFENLEDRAGPGVWERLKWAGMYAHGKHTGYFMLRTKVPGGYLTPEQAAVIGEVADEFATAPDEFGGAEQNEFWGMRTSTSRPDRTSKCTGFDSKMFPRSGDGTTQSA
ncbi:hypothetical protein ACFQH3_14965 [Haladaptatus sp. GCM10025707]|uniref:hypothetical protein n=1 Tax=unclassified Haladaptatus TaxID=2622732 RepID=UPI00361AE83B